CRGRNPTEGLTPMSTFAQRLKAAREKAGLSMYALAKKAGVSKQGLFSLEAGINEPTWSTVQRLAAALGVDCTEFVDPGLQLPQGEAATTKPRGRPRKASGPRRKKK